jgi:hypothetical protein
MLTEGDPGAFGTDISPTFGESLKTFLDGTYSDASWAIMVIAAVFLFQALVPRKKDVL